MHEDFYKFNENAYFRICVFLSVPAYEEWMVCANRSTSKEPRDDTNIPLIQLNIYVQSNHRSDIEDYKLAV